MPRIQLDEWWIHISVTYNWQRLSVLSWKYLGPEVSFLDCWGLQFYTDLVGWVVLGKSETWRYLGYLVVLCPTSIVKARSYWVLVTSEHTDNNVVTKFLSTENSFVNFCIYFVIIFTFFSIMYSYFMLLNDSLNFLESEWVSKASTSCLFAYIDGEHPNSSRLYLLQTFPKSGQRLQPWKCWKVKGQTLGSRGPGKATILLR